MKNKKIIIIITLIILLIIAILITSKIIIVKKILTKFDELDKETNFHIVSYSHSTNCNLIETWVNDNEGLDKYVEFSNPEVIKYNYNNENEGVYKSYQKNADDKIVLMNEVEQKFDGYGYGNPIKEYADVMRNYLKANIFSYSISSETVNGIECYKIKGRFDDTFVFIDKSTGMKVREIFHNDIANFDEVCDYSITFNTVTDKDFEFLKGIEKVEDQ